MKVEKLIEEYNAAKKIKKDYDFKSHITVTYMPYIKKITLAKSIVDSTSYEDILGKKVFKRNSVDLLFVFTMKMIEAYTDLEWKKDDVINVYDILMETGVMNGLMSNIPDTEYSILKGMVDMYRDDLEISSQSVVAYLENTKDSIQIFLESVENALQKPEIQAKLAEIIK